MKKILVAIIMISIGITPMNSGTHQADTEKDRIVYICTGPKVVAYHYDENCKGLNKCSRSIKAVRLRDVPKRHRPCKICAE